MEEEEVEYWNCETEGGYVGVLQGDWWEGMRNTEE